MKSESGSSSTSSRISTKHIQNVLEKLKATQNRSTTRDNYYSIWKKFNNFVIQLDSRPESWEERFSLYTTHLVKAGTQSTTIRSYASAIKAILKCDGYDWNDQKVLLSTIVKACNLVNDVVKTRLPIGGGLLELLLFELEHKFLSLQSPQPYLCIMYKAIMSLGYFGLLRVGELTLGPHTIKAKDIHIGANKDKILIILYSSKTHDKGSRP